MRRTRCVDEYNDFASLLARYRSALARLETLGIRVPATSRLLAYARHLQQVIDDARPAIEYELVLALAFDLREVDEFIEIVEFLPTSPDSATLALLRRVQGGAENLDDESSASAREAQYELYLGTIIRRAGFSAHHGKPDLVIQAPNGPHYLEAKRPSSEDRFDDQLRSAVHQVRRLPKAGIIAISLDRVIRPVGTILLAPTLDFVAPEVARLVAKFVATHSSMWRNRLGGEPVDALLLTARVPARLEATGHLVLGSNIHVEMLAHADTAASSADVIASIVQAYIRVQQPGEA